MTQPAISSVSPFFIVANVPATLAFYRDKLGFEITFGRQRLLLSPRLSYRAARYTTCPPTIVNVGRMRLISAAGTVM